MNKDLRNGLTADEQPVASKLDSLAEDMQLSSAFQWELENQLMDAAKKKTRPSPGWRTKVTPTLGWTILALFAVISLNWIVRSLVPTQPSTPVETTVPELSFADQVRQGDICAGPLALAHGFAVFLTNQDKTGFMMLDQQKTIGELRSFAWSPDGRHLAIVGNTTGRGNIYLMDSAGNQLQPVLSDSALGYLRDAAWSRDGRQILMWSSQIENNSVVFLVNADGTSLVEKRLDVLIFGTPQFAPDNASIIYYGAKSFSSDGLYQARVDGSRARMINNLVENDTGFAWSPDGPRLAYVEMDRGLGEARLVVEDIVTGSRVVIASLPIPKGSGSSIPESANLSWSSDGKYLIFDFGRGATDRAVYLAYADGAGLVKLADSAHAPAISADGRCLAYISNKQVFLMDLNSTLLTPPAETPLLLADLPVGRAIADFRLDKLQWRPGVSP